MQQVRRWSKSLWTWLCVLVAVAVAVALAGRPDTAPADPSAPRPAPVVAIVGSQRLDEADLERRVRVVLLYYPQANARRAALAQMVEAALALEGLRQRGIGLGDREVEEEADRIERQTRAPHRLADIKAVFASDREAYLRVFVRPQLALRKLVQASGAGDAFGPWFAREIAGVRVTVRSDHVAELRAVSWASALDLATFP
jgi:hypothetical protein